MMLNNLLVMTEDHGMLLIRGGKVSPASDPWLVGEINLRAGQPQPATTTGPFPLMDWDDPAGVVAACQAVADVTKVVGWTPTPAPAVEGAVE